jgi:FkbM family methyltransferase
MRIAAGKLLDMLFAMVPGARARLRGYLLSDKLHRLHEKVADLVRQGLKVDVIYDIGARHGEWAKSISKILPRAEIILFEGNEKCSAILAQSGFKSIIAVLSAEAKVVEFYDGDSTGDSYYKENTSHYDAIAATQKQTTTLSAVVGANQLPLPDFIKLDTQGSELDILKGAGPILRSVSLLYLECPILPYNSAAPLLQDYLSYLSSIDFVPCDLCEIHVAHGTLLQVDVLFISKARLKQLFPSAFETFHFLHEHLGD